MRQERVVAVLLFFLSLAGFLGRLVEGVPSCAQQLITVTPPGSIGGSNLVSENFDAVPDSNQFLVNSISGFLCKVDCSGTATQFTTFATNKFGLGVKYNPFDGNIYALYTTFPIAYNQSNQGYVAVFDPNTGASLAYTDLTPYGVIAQGMLPQDIAFDSGQAWITDALSNRLYFLNTKTYQASLYSTSSLYPGVPLAATLGIPVGVDGIFRPPGAHYLVVSKVSDANGVVLLNVPDASPDSPVAVTIVNENATGIPLGLDGIVYDKTTCNLYGANIRGYIYRLYSIDDWATAYIDGIAPVTSVLANPTYGGSVSVIVTPAGDVYAQNLGQFNPAGVGTIEKVTFSTTPVSYCPSSPASASARPFWLNE